eukprot:CAMPEP_0197182528 /NCGR_PEP_ID=MMETSP1423-20130617/6456_1 /TAXON_ID=476441 /ORGANISM="Pseudo-nitzschia heimii, Strain UNC1101" /LENGTH=218 /DNA_ID=CAMNT_0042632963 /DNA_START=78 /DNA_END=734 /DNA_ORIENTATION=-
MKTCLFTAIFSLSFSSLGCRAFVGSEGRATKPRPNAPSPRSEFSKPPALSAPTSRGLQGRRRIDDDLGDSTDANVAFAALSTDRDNRPNKGNFFYNDEVISHLYGYMYLVGFFAAQDALFVGSFLVLSSATAWATDQSLLPCNPRIPALTAAATLASTVFLRYVVGFEPPLEAVIESYQGPTESAVLFESIICLLNIGWGFFGTWRTKEQVNGATYGF